MKRMLFVMLIAILFGSITAVAQRPKTVKCTMNSVKKAVNAKNSVANPSQNTTLVVVDCQYDFCNPQGSLYVPGAEKAVDNVLAYLQSHPNINEVIFTVDWHNAKDGSFKAQGGPWPPHCIRFSKGSQIDERLIQACLDKNIPYQVIRKGEVIETEEYGAFQKITPAVKGKRTLCTMTDKVTSANTNFVICGVAGDYCVLETLKNLLKGGLHVDVYTNGVASIDKGEKLSSYIKEKNLKVAND